MFVKAIEEISRFTRPVHTIYRFYGQNKVHGGAATLFFVNREGTAITCRHVAEQIVNAERINENYLLFTQKRFRLTKDEDYDENLRQIEGQFQYTPESLIQMKHFFMNCFDRISGFEINLHPELDLAIIQFKGFNQILYQGQARFIEHAEEARPGRFLCRLGYPFPEFSNFMYNYQTDDINWTREGNTQSPSFPIEGIITRLMAQNGRITGIEMSSPGLRGQSGGPLFDPEGLIYGMQSSTRHYHMGFDLENFELTEGPKTKKVTNMPFLHVGQCIHAVVIKDFLHANGVKFQAI